VQAEALHEPVARVGFDHCNVMGQLALMGITVAVSPAQPVLLVGEQHDAHGATWAQTQLLEQARDLHREDDADAVVLRTLPHVPRVDVPADHDDLLG
jgi:hypothetical protein